LAIRNLDSSRENSFGLLLRRESPVAVSIATLGLSPSPGEKEGKAGRQVLPVLHYCKALDIRAWSWLSPMDVLRGKGFSPHLAAVM
jgi:hypothetical protein